MAAGKVVGVNPEAWKVIDGKLFLSWSKEGLDRFQENATAKIARADEVWAKLREKN